MTCMSASTKASKFGRYRSSLFGSFTVRAIVICRAARKCSGYEIVYLNKEWGSGYEKISHGETGSKFAHGGISYFRFRLLRECLSSSFSDLNETL